MVTKAKPTAKEALESGDIDEKTAFMLFDPSPEASEQFIESLLTIPNEQQKVVEMKLFPQQKRMLREASGRDITIKGRQTRASSLILARNLRPMVTRFGVKQLVMTQDDQTTTQFRLRIKHHLEDLKRNGWDVGTTLDNENEIVIKGLENQYTFASGQQQVVGRGYSAHYVHLSELSHWPKQELAQSLLGAITPAVPGPPHGQFDIESTPNGAEDVFYDYTMDAKPNNPNSRWLSHFYPWWEEPRYKAGMTPDCDLVLTPSEYKRQADNFVADAWEQHLVQNFGLTVDQLLWRRSQKMEMAKTGVPFQQEYPETLDGCFVASGDSFFASPDGVDHLGAFRQELCEPLMVKDSLPFRGGDIPFHGQNLLIWELPRPGQPYCGWLDCAGGGLDERSDFSVLIVLNALSKRHVATLRLKAAPNEVAPMACAVMSWYNTGLFGGERDAFGASALGIVQELRYPNIWYHYDPTKTRQQMEPWLHPTQGRNRVLQSFREMVFAHTFLTRDKRLLLEMGAFTWQKTRGREQLKVAGKGQKDDMVIAAAGACYIAEEASAKYNSMNRAMNQPVIVGPYGLVRQQRSLLGAQPWLR